MDEQKKEFTGIWIPRVVVEDENLSWIERALYAEIACYKQCFMSNAFFAKRLGVSERYVQEMLAKLKALGHIEDTGFDGRKRYLRAVYDGPVRGRGEPQFVADTNHSSPIDNSIDNKENIVLHSQNAFVEDETIEMVDDNGDPIKPRTKKGKDPLIELFRSECKKQVGINPVIPIAAAHTMLNTARKHLTDKQIEAMFRDWFALGKPDNETLQITRALSTARINTFKADNGIK